MAAQDEIEVPRRTAENNQKRGWLIAIFAVSLVVTICIALWTNIGRSAEREETTDTVKTTESNNVVEMKKGEGTIEIVTVSAAAPFSKFTATGTVEANQQQMQQITALATGRVESVNVALGDAVRPDMLLIVIDSPEVAEMHGKLHEAETRLRLAKETLNRVKQSASRVLVLKAKASLDEANYTLSRTKQLVAEGLVARKDLVSAESDQARAQAEYNYQKDITLNKEVSEATAALSTAQTEVEHIQDALKAIDAQLSKAQERKEHDISTLELRSPIAGTVIDRAVNPGAGVEAGKPLLTVANTSTLWVIANVPEREMQNVQINSKAKVVLEGQTIFGTVSFIDPRLNEDTRTSRVRIIINNPGNRIQTGAFAQIEFSRSAKSSNSIHIPGSAIQTVDGRQVVFVQGVDGKFTRREVKAGLESEGLTPIESGLKEGEKIAANGSFVLKSKLLRDQLGGDE